MITDLNQYGQFYGGNSLVISGENACGEPRLYPNNAYYRFNKLRDEGDWPANISGIYYGKGDCINCPKTPSKDFKDFSWKENIQGDTFLEKLNNSKITDINTFLMNNSKLGVADIHYKFLGPVFQRLIIGYQVFWPMQGYQNPTDRFDTNYVSSDLGSRMVGTASSEDCANKPGVGEWQNDYNGTTIKPWAQMKRKIMGDYHSPSISQLSKLNVGAWYWSNKTNYYQWYINSNFKGLPKISGFNGINKKFSELRIVFDSCSVSNIENRVRIQCPTPGSHIFAGSSLFAQNNLKYQFLNNSYDNDKTIGCFIEYFALIFTDKEKDTLNLVQEGIVDARNSNNFYDVSNLSTFNDLLQQYGLSINGGTEISGFANIEITGFGLPRAVNINLCSSDYQSSQLNIFMKNVLDYSTPENVFPLVGCSDGLSIYNPNYALFSGINIATSKDLHSNRWSEPKGLWTSGRYLDPPFYNGDFLRMADANYMGIQRYFLGNVKNSILGSWYDPNFYPINVNGDGASYYAIPHSTRMESTGWFCRYRPCPGCPDGYTTESHGYIPGKFIFLENYEPGINAGLIIPFKPLYFIHGYAGALLTVFDFEAPGGGFYCGDRSYPYLNRPNECNLPMADHFSSFSYQGVFMLSPQNLIGDFAHFGFVSEAGFLEEGIDDDV